MALTVPTTPVPNQTLNTILSSQQCAIALRSAGTTLYFSLTSNGVSIIKNKPARDRNRLLLGSNYLGFMGDFTFVDTQGTDDPSYLGLGTRFSLVYLQPGIDLL